ncbi:MAG: hypothetical protein SW833_10350 [Cyanobacteriota bacterium]|nr:hypothetical protein [Cyanobacteriota bacterium]
MTNDKFNYFFPRLAVSVWWIYLFHFRHLAAGSDRFFLLTMALVERGSVRLDSYYNNPFYASYLGDILLHEGHAYSNINPGLSFLAVPAWAVVHFFYQFIPPSSLLRQDIIHYFIAHFVCFAFTTALLSALTVWLLAVLTYKKTGCKWRSLLAGSLYGLGSIAFFFSTRANQNIPVAFIGVCVFVLIFEPDLLGKLKPQIGFFAIGFLLGWGPILDITAMPLLFVFSILLLIQNRSSRINLVYILLGALLPIAGQMLYHFVAFGNPFLSPSMLLAQPKAADAVVMNPVGLGLRRIYIGSLLEYLFTPKSGFFIYMPYAALATWYFIRFWLRNQLFNRIEKFAIAGIFITYSLFMTVVPAQYLYSLFGPRYLLPLVPFVCLIFAVYFRRQELQLGTILIGIGLTFNVAGAQLGNDTGNIFLSLAVYAIKGPWLPILDWVQKELFLNTNYSPEVISPYGLFLMLLIGLFILWSPFVIKALLE